MRRFFAISAVLGLFGLATLAVRADEDVYLKDKAKPVKGVIKQENGKGITVAGKGTFPAEQIDDIYYELLPLTIRLQEYKPGFQAEKDASLPAKEAQRKTLLAEALA